VTAGRCAQQCQCAAVAAPGPCPGAGGRVQWSRPATRGSSWRANCGWCRGDLGDLDPVVAGHLIPFVGRRDERLAELPHVGRGAQRDALVAALGDIYVPGNLTFGRLRPPDLDCEVVVVRVVGPIDEPLRSLEVPGGFFDTESCITIEHPQGAIWWCDVGDQIGTEIVTGISARRAQQNVSELAL